jgi:hypothetical protein
VAGFNAIRASLRHRSVRALTVATCITWLSGSCVLAADNSGAGVEGSAAADMPDVPIPSTAQGTYSPVVEGFVRPFEPCADLRAAQPEKRVRPKAKAPPPEAETEEQVWLYGLKQSLDDDAPFLRDTLT